ncbi:MAG TPA: metal-activated pyridoxal enzyme [Desulfofustis sp.]|jgi:D-serine deaminase-like pyridoxal phosphate-dependent protein|nr:metal-activated pyridoxal enzyme [Desulfofustis sp.]HBH30742.1 metal-activated pyridoxal enzyme [Desulfofustis sp.]
MKITELQTPCLVLDLDILMRNINKMQASVMGAGKQLRPHVKSHKCSALARVQREAGAVGLCVAKLSEAQSLIDNDLDNILITGPVAGHGKMELLAELVEKSPSLMATVDHRVSIDRLDTLLAARNTAMDVLLDIDVGLGRTGVRCEHAYELADYIDRCTSLRLRGIQAYAGQVQHIVSFDERKQASRASLQGAVDVFTRVRKRVPGCTIFSASGTGTFNIDTDIEEITELQTGSYVLMDAEYLHVQSAPDAPGFEEFAPALKLLTSVVSANQTGFVTVDAGLKALYQHGAVPKVVGPSGFDLVYDWFGDEYGKVSAQNGSAVPPLNSVLEIVVSHCDPTVNLFDEFNLVRGDEVVGTWPIDLRGCCR